MAVLKDAESRPLNLEQVRELTGDDLRLELDRLVEAQFRLRYRAATEELDNKLQFRTLRRNIARLRTVLRERELAAAREE
jgi:large subunit ribosomal protein L29